MQDKELVARIIAKHGAILDLERNPGAIIDIIRTHATFIDPTVAETPDGGVPLPGGVPPSPPPTSHLGSVRLEDIMRTLLSLQRDVAGLKKTVMPIKTKAAKVIKRAINPVPLKAKAKAKSKSKR
jgi:hypothetical protein